MQKLPTETQNKVTQNRDKIAALFPNCLTERKNKDGVIEHVIDFDKLKQELSDYVVEGSNTGENERYQFTWPDKKKSILLANAPISKTLRPCREESVNFDTTENLYIEGDNLDVLKILQETYLNKVKMIYIDPPYNTGNDFVYEDDFAQSLDEYKEISGDYDEEGNRLFKNTDSNGRFHTDWLNMIYPRLKVAKDLLTEDGVIFISIDDNEVHNLRKICDEIFGERNFVAQFPWRSRTAKADVPNGVSNDVEWVVTYTKHSFIAGRIGERNYYESDDYDDRWRLQDITTNKTKDERPNSFFTLINPKNGKGYPPSELRTWCVTTETFNSYYEMGKIVFPEDYDFLNIKKPAFRVFEAEDKSKAFAKYGTDETRMAISSYLPESIGRTEHGTKEIRELFNNNMFPYPKPTSLIKYFLSSLCDKNSIILDFFSGSATTAHAVMQLNAEDNGNRKFIMVQLPEETAEKSEAFKAGYKNICEIGKERIRRAGAKIKEENPLTTQDLDTGFRVLKVDSSNTKEDIYKRPLAITQADLFEQEDNIKEERTAADLLFQAMLQLGVLLSHKIEETTIAGKKVFTVNYPSLIACFDEEITEEVITEIAKRKPFYFVMRDSSMASDSLAVNFDNIFKQYSDETKRLVL